MSKTLLDCGNCGPDFHAIRQMVSNHFGASVVQSHGVEDTLELLRNQSVDLDPELESIPVMLVTNYDEHQDAAMAAGCVRGFGKLAIKDPETRNLLKPFLQSETG